MEEDSEEWSLVSQAKGEEKYIHKWFYLHLCQVQSLKVQSQSFFVLGMVHVFNVFISYGLIDFTLAFLYLCCFWTWIFFQKFCYKGIWMQFFERKIVVIRIILKRVNFAGAFSHERHGYWYFKRIAFWVIYNFLKWAK